jgi:hypothetical protein
MQFGDGKKRGETGGEGSSNLAFYFQNFNSNWGDGEGINRTTTHIKHADWLSEAKKKKRISTKVGGGDTNTLEKKLMKNSRERGRK